MILAAPEMECPFDAGTPFDCGAVAPFTKPLSLVVLKFPGGGLGLRLTKKMVHYRRSWLPEVCRVFQIGESRVTLEVNREGEAKRDV